MEEGLVISQLGISFDGQEVLHDVSLKISPGEFVCLLGSSGSGKTTLLNAVAGLVRPSKGTVVWNGAPVEGPGPERSVVFQEYSLFPWLTLLGNVTLAIRKTHTELSRREAQALAEEYLRLVGLGPSLKKYPFELSGGMRQRGAIARALGIGSRFLLLDEPFGALDPVNRAQLQDLLLNVCRTEVRRTVLFVTHDIAEALYLGSRVVVLGASPGRVIADLPLDFPARKNREQWVQDERVRQLSHEIELAYHQDVLSRLEPSYNGAEVI